MELVFTVWAIQDHKDKNSNGKHPMQHHISALKLKLDFKEYDGIRFFSATIVYNGENEIGVFVLHVRAFF